MSKTKGGKKIVEARSHLRRTKSGKKVKVREYRRSTPDHCRKCR